MTNETVRHVVKTVNSGMLSPKSKTALSSTNDW